MKFLIILFVLMLINLPLMAYNDNHYNSGTVTKSESATQVTYKWTLTVPALGDSIGSWHSPALFIADCNSADGVVYAVGTAGSGTEDHNIIYHFSLDNARDTWATTTPHTLDQLGGTAVLDTIGYEQGANDMKFSLTRWLVVEYDGQAGNESNRAFTFVIAMTKDLTLTDSAANFTLLSRTATDNGTNP